MVFSYNWLQSFFKRKLPRPEKLAELLTMHSFEVTEVKKTGNDWILNIDVLPNRGPDCFSHLGIAREISAILNWRLEIENWGLKEDKNLKAKDFISVDVKYRRACLRYTARVIFDVKVGLSPKWIRERLQVCGLRPINNIVDIVNYVMLETGQPLHGFDLEELEGVNPKQIQNSKFKIKKIVVRFAKEGERIVTLDEEKYDLSNDILVIADAKKPVAIAGIKGGKKAEITKSTKVVVLESANFNRKIVRSGSKKIDLKTDASWRFEHGIDPNLTELAINRAAYLIQKIAGGRVARGLVDIYPKKPPTKIWWGAKRIRLDLDYVERLLGVKISQNEIKNILKRLEFKIDEVEPRQLSVEVPTRRLDLSLPEDLIEEIGRIYGYQKIPSLFPTTALIPAKRNLEIFWEKMVKDILKEGGLTEVYNYSFIGEREKEIFNFKNLIELENPTSAEYKYLRPSLIPNLLKDIQRNQRFFKDIRIFELGRIFKGLKCEEKRMVTGAITGEAFFEAKGIVDFLFQKLGIANLWYDQFQPTPEETEMSLWHPQRCAEIKVEGEEIGFLGEISSKIVDLFGIEGKVVIFDLDFEKLLKLASEETIYQPVSPYPAAIRDLSVLVPKGILVEEVLNEIERVGGELIRDVDLFDIYEGGELPAGKKNLAFHIIYQAKDRTLTSKEIDKIQNKIIQALEKEADWEVRK